LAQKEGNSPWKNRKECQNRIMCGIVGYIGMRNATDVILDSLRRLEYRGYDSAGMALGINGQIEIYKEVGKVADLAAILEKRKPRATRGIGHTRWATHGGVTVANAHPHSDGSRRFALVHNGIIENYLDIKEELELEGEEFVSETDTEVIVHLLAKVFEQTQDMVRTVAALQERLQGSFAKGRCSALPIFRPFYRTPGRPSTSMKGRSPNSRQGDSGYGTKRERFKRKR
jgi:glucosamine 6-phosphate synthetase-like amidotransferase/phosphosugar isomerase protein